MGVFLNHAMQIQQSTETTSLVSIITYATEHLGDSYWPILVSDPSPFSFNWKHDAGYFLLLSPIPVVSLSLDLYFSY